MTSPDHAVPTKTYTAADIYQSQSVDPAVLAAANNADMQDQGEEVRLLFKANVADPLAHNLIVTEDVVSDVEAAANAAAAAQETADLAYGLSSYWEAECVVASAEVQLGVNELLIGLCQNRPTDRVRSVTDWHIALVDQPGGMTIEMKKFNDTGTSSSVVFTATLGANVTRVSYNNLGLDMADKERVFWNVASITGTILPTVLQCLLFGVITGD